MIHSKVRVPFVDLSRQFRVMEKDLTRIFKEVGNSGGYVSGEPVLQFLGQYELE